MPANLLSAVKCKVATCEDAAIRKLHDGAGLYLWVYPNGSKYWRFRYKVQGKERGLALGVYPTVGLQDARAKRDEVRRQLSEGMDPATERRSEKRKAKIALEDSFEAVARDWYGRQSHTWTPGHRRDVLRRLEADIFPVLGFRPIAAIDAPELLAAVRKIEARGAYDLAHRVLQVCGQVFRYGIATGRCRYDLAASLRGALTPHEKHNQHAVRPEDFPALVRAIRGYEEIGARQTRLALELLALTFVRTSELLGAVWSEFDLSAALWAIPAERMKMRAEHLVPLSRQALAILADLKALSGTSRYIVPGSNPNKTMSNNTLLFALYRLGYKDRMTGHGFRAVASTILNEKNWRADVIERQLAHCERNAVRGAYNRAEYLEDRRKMMQWWADYVDLVSTESNVILGKFGAA